MKSHRIIIAFCLALGLAAAPAAAQLVIQPELSSVNSSVSRGIERHNATVLKPAVALGIEGERWLWSAGAGLEVTTRQSVRDANRVWDAWAEAQAVVTPGVRVHTGFLHTSLLAFPRMTRRLAGNELFGGLTVQPANATLASAEFFHNIAADRGTYLEVTASQQLALLEFHRFLLSAYLQGLVGSSFGGDPTERPYAASGVTHALALLGVTFRQPVYGGTAVLSYQAGHDRATMTGWRIEVHLSYRITRGEE